MVLDAPKQVDFPHVRFWTRKDYQTDCDANSATCTDKSRGKVRASKGINVGMRYFEDKNGVMVDGHVASDIRQWA
jgi:prepilin-type processing-associated H-X9-DG protein